MPPRRSPPQTGCRRVSAKPWAANDLGSDHGDVRQGAVLFGVIETIADDKAIVDREADVLDPHVDLASRRLAQEAGGPERFRAASSKNLLQIHEREAGVDDVFDDDDVLALEPRIEVLEKAHFARA